MLGLELGLQLGLGLVWSWLVGLIGLGLVGLRNSELQCSGISYTNRTRRRVTSMMHPTTLPLRHPYTCIV